MSRRPEGPVPASGPGQPPHPPEQATGSVLGDVLSAAAMFSVLPVPARLSAPSRRTVRWLPAVGVVLGALAFVPALAVWRGGPAGSPLLGAVLVVAALAGLTRGLHLDGAADLADGLGSARPAAQALQIMRRSDVGPFGVVTLVLLLAAQIAALATVLGGSSRPAGLIAVVFAAVIGRVAVVVAARPGVAVAPGSSLARLVAGTAPRRTGIVWAVSALVAAAAVFWATGSGSAGRQLAAGLGSAGCGLVGLLAATLLARHAVRRLSGVNGDVFGALVETGTTVTLAALAVVTVWLP